MCDESRHDELMNAMPFEEEIQIGNGETARTPMLLSDDIARLGFYSRRDVCPALVVAGPIPVVKRIENADAGGARSFQDLGHVRNALVGFSAAPKAIPYFAALGNEIVVRINYHQAGAVLVIDHLVILPLARRRRPSRP